MIKIDYIEKGKVYFASTKFDKNTLDNTSKTAIVSISSDTIDSIYSDIVNRHENKFLTKKYYIEVLKGSTILDINIRCRDNIKDFSGTITISNDNARIFLGLKEPDSTKKPPMKQDGLHINKDNILGKIVNDLFTSYLTKAESGLINYAIEMKEDANTVGFGSLSIPIEERIDFIWELYNNNDMVEKPCSIIELIVPNLILKDVEVTSDKNNGEFDDDNMGLIIEPKEENGIQKLVMLVYYDNTDLVYIEEPLKIGEGNIWKFLYSPDMENHPRYIEMKKGLFR